jgi:hypothetical protein
MKNISKFVAIGAVGLLMTACSSTYKIKSESGKVMNSVPKWYMADYSESKACDTPWLGKDKDRMCIFGVATAVSPDLQLAIEKGKMMAKSELADIIAGKMNKESKQFITELGKTNTKTVVSEVESVIVNKIDNTPVRGYEIFKQDVTLTKNGYYRVWIGLRLPLGEYNKMYNFTVAEAVDAYNLKEKAQIKYKELMKDDDNADNNL